MSESSSVDFFSSIVAQNQGPGQERALARQPMVERAASALESLDRPVEELVPDWTPEPMRAATAETLRRLRRREALQPQHIHALEAIIIPDQRPPILIQDGDYTVKHKAWLQLNDPRMKALIKPAIAAVCRIELPGSGAPFLGTGFLVGEGLLMTNRHVAEAFVDGVGRAHVSLMSGAAPFVDFLKEFGREKAEPFEIDGVVMVHPYWDMALLRLRGLPQGHPHLTLSQAEPDDMLGRDVAVIGYPARDEGRNNAGIQRDVFGEVFNVKRLQPGKIGGAGATAGRARLVYPSFEQDVSAMLHNASTLGGNSGSAIVDLTNGEILGLHFAGEYLKFNCGVPAAELAVDARVVDAGVSFSGPTRASMDAWLVGWNRVEPSPESAPADDARRAPPGGGGNGLNIMTPASADGVIRLTVPLEISIRLGSPSLGGPAPDRVMTAPVGATAVEKAVEPFHDDNYQGRSGYQADFLGLALPLPDISDLSQVSKLDDGDHILRYQHFSVVMRKARRMALFTAANVDGAPAVRKPDPGQATTRGALGGLSDGDTEKWFIDPRIPALHQLPDRFFTKDRMAFDKGHLVRREDVAWGRSFAELRRANGDTYHVTNCSPQVAGFNRSARGKDNWGDLENFVAKAAKRGRISLFSGPVFEQEDEIFQGVDSVGKAEVQIPKAYWKVVVEAEDGALLAYAFILRQDLSNVNMQERLQVPDGFKPFMVPLAELERRLELIRFPRELHEADQFSTARGESVRQVEGIVSGGVSRKTPRRRSAGDLDDGPKTFRDPILSVFQSATAKVARRRAAAASAVQMKTEGVQAGNEGPRWQAAHLIIDAERACESALPGAAPAPRHGRSNPSAQESLSWSGYATNCATQLLELAWARATGDEVTARDLLDRAKMGKCDPEWADTVYEYAKAYGVLGDPNQRAYVAPDKLGDWIIPMDPKSSIAIFGDWGTGAGPARLVMSNIREKRPDILLHLGDIYYSGTPEETQVNFEAVIEEAYQGAQERPAIYTLCGNHDMYSGGKGFYGLIERLNKKDRKQKASYFCLRATDNSWQILAMDSGRNDYHPLLHKRTFIEEAEQVWLVARVKDFKGRTILMSHHQLFSAFDAPGGALPSGGDDPVNPRLKALLDRLVEAGANIAAWFWGHEHNLCVYEPYAGLARGRCVGHGGVPVFVSEEPYAPLETLENPPKTVEASHVAANGEYFAHGFAILELQGTTAGVAYYQNVGGVLSRHYAEQIDP